jgi:hypothetical protein
LRRSGHQAAEPAEFSWLGGLADKTFGSDLRNSVHSPHAVDCAEKQTEAFLNTRRPFLPSTIPSSPAQMGDPLSVTASIVALLQLTQAVVHGLNGMKDASKERISIRDEIIYVSGLLYNLKGQVTRSEIWSGIISSLVCPRGPLEQLKEALEQLTMRLSPAEGLRKVGKSIAGHSRKAKSK